MTGKTCPNDKTKSSTDLKETKRQKVKEDLEKQEFLNPLTKFALGLTDVVLPMLETKKTIEIKSSSLNTTNYKKQISLTEDRFKCTICSQTFKTSSHYDYHKRVHNDVRAFGCEICGKRFITKQAKQKHSFVHNRGNQQKFVCSICNKQFQTQQNLRNHLNTHNENKPYKCEKCQKSFAEKSTLSKHLTTHSKVGSKQKHMKKFHSLNISEYGGFLPALGAEVVANELKYLESAFLS